MTDDEAADAADAFIGSLPVVIDGLNRGRRQNRWIAFGTAVALLVGGWFLDRQQEELSDAQDQLRAARDRDRQIAYETCQAINENARGINGAVDTAIESIRLNDTLTAAEKRQRVAAWEDIRQTVPACTPPEDR